MEFMVFVIGLCIGGVYWVMGWYTHKMESAFYENQEIGFRDCSIRHQLMCIFWPLTMFLSSLGMVAAFILWFGAGVAELLRGR